MRLTITWAWSRMRLRERRCGESYSLADFSLLSRMSRHLGAERRLPTEEELWQVREGWGFQAVTLG